MPEHTVLLGANPIKRALARIAHEIAERNEASHEVVLVGIQRGGVHLAERLSQELKRIWGHDTPVGSLDISMHRDDLNQRALPVVHATQIPVDITDRTVVVVDDVLFSGRSTRAALDALHDLGRPRRVQLAVLIDRGHRELPIRADFVGKNVPTAPHERINVRLAETDGEDSVSLERV